MAVVQSNTSLRYKKYHHQPIILIRKVHMKSRRIKSINHTMPTISQAFMSFHPFRQNHPIFPVCVCVCVSNLHYTKTYRTHVHFRLSEQSRELNRKKQSGNCLLIDTPFIIHIQWILRYPLAEGWKPMARKLSSAPTRAHAWPLCSRSQGNIPRQGISRHISTFRGRVILLCCWQERW